MFTPDESLRMEYAGASCTPDSEFVPDGVAEMRAHSDTYAELKAAAPKRRAARTDIGLPPRQRVVSQKAVTQKCTSKKHVVWPKSVFDEWSPKYKGVPVVWDASKAKARARDGSLTVTGMALSADCEPSCPTGAVAVSVETTDAVLAESEDADSANATAATLKESFRRGEKRNSVRLSAVEGAAGALKAQFTRPKPPVPVGGLGGLDDMFSWVSVNSLSMKSNTKLEFDGASACAIAKEPKQKRARLEPKPLCLTDLGGSAASASTTASSGGAAPSAPSSDAGAAPSATRWGAVASKANRDVTSFIDTRTAAQVFFRSIGTFESLLVCTPTAVKRLMDRLDSRLEASAVAKLKIACPQDMQASTPDQLWEEAAECMSNCMENHAKLMFQVSTFKVALEHVSELVNAIAARPSSASSLKTAMVNLVDTVHPSILAMPDQMYNTLISRACAEDISSSSWVTLGQRLTRREGDVSVYDDTNICFISMDSCGAEQILQSNRALTARLPKKDSNLLTCPDARRELYEPCEALIKEVAYKNAQYAAELQSLCTLLMADACTDPAKLRTAEETYSASSLVTPQPSTKTGKAILAFAAPRILQLMTDADTASTLTKLRGVIDEMVEMATRIHQHVQHDKTSALAELIKKWASFVTSWDNMVRQASADAMQHICMVEFIVAANKDRKSILNIVAKATQEVFWEAVMACTTNDGPLTFVGDVDPTMAAIALSTAAESGVKPMLLIVEGPCEDASRYAEVEAWDGMVHGRQSLLSLLKARRMNRIAMLAPRQLCCRGNIHLNVSCSRSIDYRSGTAGT
jgi:hypothetical protein